MRSLLVTRLQSLRCFTTSGRQMENKVPEYQKLFQALAMRSMAYMSLEKSRSIEKEAGNARPDLAGTPTPPRPTLPHPCSCLENSGSREEQNLFWGACKIEPARKRVWRFFPQSVCDA
ncbi:uncharacterized protein LOC117677791 isoform X1 [Pantherophis guttatus]|uniref:Uncharacterized protein LOC117677791 isoform X1 n=1 Tax=Pantherophis guttatus TaxID=94885 RepID=A0ABM3ZMZ5_PANGU|nr:uncharacterized protein LOC117677791 isoform X1 [Pantherophis guttatus]